MNGRVYDPVLGKFLSADPFVQDTGDSQAYNRYSYVGNNPLNHTDPSGYFKLSFKTILKIVAVVVIAYFTAGAAIGAFGVTSTMTGTMATGFTVTTTVGSSLAAALPTAIANGIIGGLAGGFASGFAGSLLNGGSVGDAFKAGVVGAAVGAVTGGVAGVFSESSLLTRTLAGAAVGGVSSEATGGSFFEGAAIGAGVVLAAEGFERARKFTDENALRASDNSPERSQELLSVDKAGELQTAGVLPTERASTIVGPKWINKAFAPVNKMWEVSSMKGQGSGLNWFERLGKDGPINRFIQSVSKVHDWMNSWGYNLNAGCYVTRGNLYDSIFSTYSWAAMPPAGIYTAVAQQPSGILMTAARQSQRGDQ